MKVSESRLENARYRVSISREGDVTSIFDKSLHKELLSAPFRLAISNDAPRQWPAWNMDFDQEQAAPRAYVGGPAKIRVVEDGPVRVAVEVTRETEGSKFVQTVRSPRAMQATASSSANPSTGERWALISRQSFRFLLRMRMRPTTGRSAPSNVPPPGTAIRSCVTSLDRFDRPERLLRLHHPHRRQERIGQARLTTRSASHLSARRAPLQE